MTTYRELIYICLDLLKGTSDDFSYTEEHVAFLLEKYRAFLLKQRYGNDPKKYIPHENYNNLTIELYKGKSVISIPTLMNIGIPRISLFERDAHIVYNDVLYDYKIEYVPKERYPFVGNNRFLKNIKYCTLTADNSLIIKDFEDEYRTIVLTAVFEEPIVEEGESKLDSRFAIEGSLIPNLVQLVVKDLLGAAYRPSDYQNNANDDLASLAGYISKALKQPYTNNLKSEE